VPPRRRGPPGFRVTGLRRPRSYDRVGVLNRRGPPARSSTTSRSTTSIREPTRRAPPPTPLTHHSGCARPTRQIRVATFTCVALSRSAPAAPLGADGNPQIPAGGEVDGCERQRHRCAEAQFWHEPRLGPAIKGVLPCQSDSTTSHRRFSAGAAGAAIGSAPAG